MTRANVEAGRALKFAREDACRTRLRSWRIPDSDVRRNEARRWARLANGNFNIFFLLPLCRAVLGLHLGLNNSKVIHLILYCTLSGIVIFHVSWNDDSRQSPRERRGWNYDLSSRKVALCRLLISCMTLVTHAKGSGTRLSSIKENKCLPCSMYVARKRRFYLPLGKNFV